MDRLVPRAARAAQGGRTAERIGKHRLGQFQVPVAVLIPDERVHCLGGKVETIPLDRIDCCLHRFLKQRDNPSIRGAQFDIPPTLRAIKTLCIHQHVACSVPQLVAEIAVTLNATEVEIDVAPGRGQYGEGEAQCIGAVGRNAVREILACDLLDPVRHLRLHQG